MNINILWPLELPEKITGTIVVIDVFAATTNIASFLARGCSRLVLFNDKNAYEIKKKYQDALFIGESNTLPADFFDASNVPQAHINLDLTRQTVCYMSINGTRVIEEAFQHGARKVITASIVNIDNIASWLVEKKLSTATLIPAGDGEREVVEDRICAEILRDLLVGSDLKWEKRIKDAESFIRAYYQPTDFAASMAIVLDRNRYPVVPLCHREREGVIVVSDTSS